MTVDEVDDARREIRACRAPIGAGSAVADDCGSRMGDYGRAGSGDREDEH
jgi:hypothetical protein